MLVLNARKLGIAGGLVTGGLLALLTLLAVVFGYGLCFIKAIGCLIPCFTISWCGIIVAFIFGFIFGFVKFYALARLYNNVTVCKKPAPKK